LAYIGQLLLQTLSHLKNEMYWVNQKSSDYHDMVRDSIPLLRNLARNPSPAATLLAARRSAETPSSRPSPASITASPSRQAVVPQTQTPRPQPAHAASSPSPPQANGFRQVQQCPATATVDP
jgi:hypothetical protein